MKMSTHEEANLSTKRQSVYVQENESENKGRAYWSKIIWRGQRQLGSSKHRRRAIDLISLEALKKIEHEKEQFIIQKKSSS